MWSTFKIFPLQKHSFGVTVGPYSAEITSNFCADRNLADIRIKLLGANPHLE